VDKAWEQEKLEASLPWQAKPGKTVCHKSQKAPSISGGHFLVHRNERVIEDWQVPAGIYTDSFDLTNFAWVVAI
jgi:hypothetical protein